MKEKIKIICQNCKKEFKVIPFQSNRKFCSHKCYGIDKSKNYSGKNNPCWKEKIKIICQNCKKEFKINPWRKDTAKFCSNKCRGIDKSKNYSDKNNSNWCGGKIKKICLICGIEFEVNLSKKDIAKLCSDKCRNKYQSKNYSGKNNPAWKDGISFEPYCEKFNEQKKEEIRNKYDRKCVICGRDEKDNITKTGKIRKLSVHHIDSDKEQGCDGKQWKLAPLCMYCHNSKRMEILC